MKVSYCRDLDGSSAMVLNITKLWVRHAIGPIVIKKKKSGQINQISRH
jgi:hypothetical protein